MLCDALELKTTRLEELLAAQLPACELQYDACCIHAYGTEKRVWKFVLQPLEAIRLLKRMGQHSSNTKHNTNIRTVSVLFVWFNADCDCVIIWSNCGSYGACICAHILQRLRMREN